MHPLQPPWVCSKGWMFFRLIFNFESSWFNAWFSKKPNHFPKKRPEAFDITRWLQFWSKHKSIHTLNNENLTNLESHEKSQNRQKRVIKDEPCGYKSVEFFYLRLNIPLFKTAADVSCPSYSTIQNFILKVFFSLLHNFIFRTLFTIVPKSYYVSKV